MVFHPWPDSMPQNPHLATTKAGINPAQRIGRTKPSTTRTSILRPRPTLHPLQLAPEMPQDKKSLVRIPNAKLGYCVFYATQKYPNPTPSYIHTHHPHFHNIHIHRKHGSKPAEHSFQYQSPDTRNLPTDRTLSSTTFVLISSGLAIKTNIILQFHLKTGSRRPDWAQTGSGTGPFYRHLILWV
jgi:hypothetical protein